MGFFLLPPPHILAFPSHLSSSTLIYFIFPQGENSESQLDTNEKQVLTDKYWIYCFAYPDTHIFNLCKVWTRYLLTVWSFPQALISTQHAMLE